MTTIKPFKGIRSPKDLVGEAESCPYNVLDSDEAREKAGDNEKSLYRTTKPEIDFEPGTSEYDPRVYEQAVKNFRRFQEKGWLRQGEHGNYYIYARTMGSKTQYRLVVGAYCQDYLSGVIKKHELTRRDKGEDRMRHVWVCDINIEPVFSTYPDSQTFISLIERYTSEKPECGFITPIDGFKHQLWVVSGAKDIEAITTEFKEMPVLYIADDHHRSAAATLVEVEKSKANPNHTGHEEYSYFIAICLPASQLTILDYNRVVEDLNGMSSEEFSKVLKENFDVTKEGAKSYKPQQLHEFPLYLNGKWYSLRAKQGTYDDNDPIGVLDVDISSQLILDKLLGIKDLRSGKRIDFIGGLRSLEEPKRRVSSGEMKMALALYPISIQQTMDIADSGKIMPPKATWLEPKLRSGLVIHKLS